MLQRFEKLTRIANIIFLNQQGQDALDTGRGEFDDLVDTILMARTTSYDLLEDLKDLMRDYDGFILPEKLASMLLTRISNDLKTILNFNLSDALHMIRLIEFIEKEIGDAGIAELERPLLLAIFKCVQESQLPGKMLGELLESVRRFYPKVFNRKILERLIFSVSPTNFELSRGNQELETIPHTKVISILHTIYPWKWEDLQQLISKCTPAAKSLLRRMLFNAWNSGLFIFDEEMQPMGHNYNRLHIFKGDKIAPYYERIDETEFRETWRPIFDEFKIIPLFPYFEEA